MSINQSASVSSSWKDVFPQENRYFETDNGILYCANNIEVLKQIADNVIDTVITDPPYGLMFMNKKWDYDVPSVETWQEVLRVMKPGATLLSFAGSRTQHRMAVNVEDAGFILKDTLMWLYSTGFPKAYDIAKGIEGKIRQGSANWKDWKKLGGKKYESKTGYVKLQAEQGYRDDYSSVESRDVDLTTPEAKLWDGYKSHGLKPAYEPIIMAIKQNDGSYANNALKWGVSGLNIQAGRIETNDNLNGGAYAKKGSKRKQMWGEYAGNSWRRDKGLKFKQPQGRFPANILLDEEVARLLDEQSEVSRSRAGIRRNHNKGHEGWSKGTFRSGDLYSSYNDKGGASRFFYVAKASKSERNLGLEGMLVKRPDGRTKTGMGSFEKKGIQPQQNYHPTVKPLKLMEYLIKLTLMPNPDQIYLDPFIGSGTTAIACEKFGKKWIGIELNEEYCEIAKNRIKSATRMKRLI